MPGGDHFRDKSGTFGCSQLATSHAGRRGYRDGRLARVMQRFSEPLRTSLVDSDPLKDGPHCQPQVRGKRLALCPACQTSDSEGGAVTLQRRTVPDSVCIQRPNASVIDCSLP